MAQNDIPKLKVDLLRIAVQTMGPVAAGASLSQNHWAIYLLVSDGSVRLHMTLADPCSNSLKGKLEVTRYTYAVSNSTVKSWDFAVPSGLTVGMVLKLLGEKGRQQYTMAEGGVGCRHWTYVCN